MGLSVGAGVVNAVAQQVDVAGTDGAASTGAPAVPGTEPETRVISFRHHWTREQLEVTYKIGGIYQSEAMAQIDHFMRDWRCKRSTQMDPRLIDLLYDITQDLGSKGPIRLVSAYRSEGYNASLLRAGRTVDPDSQHTQGHAVDIFFPGIRGETVRQAAIKRGVGGVGYYPFSGPQFIHVDTGPVRQWIETDPRERKTMRIAKLPRRRLQVDCSLTMTEVFENIPRDAVVEALPDGAAISAPEAAPGTPAVAAPDTTAPTFLQSASETGAAVAATQDQPAGVEAARPSQMAEAAPAEAAAGAAASAPIAPEEAAAKLSQRQKTAARPLRRLARQAAALRHAKRKHAQRIHRRRVRS